MSVSRRQLLQGTGALSLSGCDSSSSSSSASASSSTTTATASASGSASAAATGSIALDGTAWQYDATNDVYYVLNKSYVTKPQATDYETLAVIVPGKYFTGTKNSDGTYTVKTNESGTVGGFTAKTAPIVMPVNTPGYAAQKPLTAYTYSDVKEFMTAGLVYVHAGCRGKDSQSSSYAGNAPWGVVDLKSAVRYLRYNASIIPGNKDSIFTFGHSGGGAQSAIMGASGDSELYTPYLTTLGAAMTGTDGKTISDAIAGAMCWCPITSLDEANAAYEWNMGQFASTGTRASGTWTKQYSTDLAASYGPYLNSLGLKDSSGNVLALEKSTSGTYLKGSYYDHIVKVVEDSLNDFLGYTTFPYTPNNTQMAGMGGTGGTSGAAAQGGSSAGASGSAMPSGAAPSGMGSGAPSGMGSGAPSGMSGAPGASSSSSSTTYKTVAAYFEHLNSDSTWVTYDSSTKKATVKNLEGFITSQKNASKDVGALDGVGRAQTENLVMGVNSTQLHFSKSSGDVVKANQSAYEKLTNWKSDYAASGYTSDMAKTDSVGKDVQYRVNMYNPMYYLNKTYDGFGKSTVAPHWRIRTGIMQGDTASTVEVNLALAVQALKGTDVDFATVWGQGHTQAETTGSATTNFISWVKKAVA